MKDIEENKQLVFPPPKTFIFLFVLIGSLLGGMILAFYHLQTSNYEVQLRTEERHSLELQLALVRNHFKSITSDLMFLAKRESLKEYLLNPSQNKLNDIKSEYLTLSAAKQIYDQIRYLDDKGKEVVRINFNDGNPSIVKIQKLQDKHQRYYFQDTFRLNQGEIFISPLDLNIEQGKVEIPYKPMIRFGTPVYDPLGNKRGIVLLNYLGEDLLRLIKNVGAVAHGQMMLLNSNGYWLKHPSAEKEWGFMFKDKVHISMAKQSPNIWQQLLAAPSGQLNTPQGIYTFETIKLDSSLFTDPIAPTDVVATNADFWKIVSIISADTIDLHSQSLRVNLYILGVALSLLTAAIAWYLASAITRRKIYQKQLFNMAHFDNLTGLPNRTLLFDRLTQSMLLAKRHKSCCALLYIDLDGFKDVNDNLGHDAGDELLTSVGQRMKSCCRTSDTVSRLGGDEFAIILNEVSCVDGVQIFAEKILSSLALPFSLKSGDTKIGASIGVAVYPTHGSTWEELLKNADQAMYLSKSKGNTYTFVANAD